MAAKHRSVHFYHDQDVYPFEKSTYDDPEQVEKRKVRRTELDAENEVVSRRKASLKNMLTAETPEGMMSTLADSSIHLIKENVKAKGLRVDKLHDMWQKFQSPTKTQSY